MAAKPEITPDSDISNEKTVAITQKEPNEKAGLHIDDEAGQLVGLALASGPAEAEISKRVLRKIDFYILPFLCITYGIDPFLKPRGVAYALTRAAIHGQDESRIL